MLIKATQKYSRQTPTRLRLVAEAVKKLAPKDAMEQLQFMNKKAARTMLSVMKQVMANATKNLGLSAESLKIKEIVVNDGPQYKRFQPVSRGRAHSILKRTAHIRVVLESTETAMAKPKKEEVKVSTSAPSIHIEEVGKKVQPIKAERKQFGRSQTTVKTMSVRKTGER